METIIKEIKKIYSILRNLEEEIDEIKEHKDVIVTIPSGGSNGGGSGGPVSWNDVTGKPSTFPPSAHTHPISQVVGLQDALDLKINDAPSDGKTYGRKNGGWTSAFTISLNFIDETVTTIKAPRAMKINSVTAESGTPTIQVNGSPYTLGNTIAQFDEITVTATVDTLVNLNCE